MTSSWRLGLSCGRTGRSYRLHAAEPSLAFTMPFSSADSATLVRRSRLTPVDRSAGHTLTSSSHEMSLPSLPSREAPDVHLEVCGRAVWRPLIGLHSASPRTTCVRHRTQTNCLGGRFRKSLPTSAPNLSTGMEMSRTHSRTRTRLFSDINGMPAPYEPRADQLRFSFMRSEMQPVRCRSRSSVSWPQHGFLLYHSAERVSMGLRASCGKVPYPTFWRIPPSVRCPALVS